MEITLRDILVHYGEKPVLKNVTLRIPEGKLVSILGPSGSGKTTLLRVIAGLIRPQHGQVLFGDVDVTNLPAEKRRVGFVFQQPQLFPHMTLRENIRFGLDVGKWQKKRSDNRIAVLFHALQLEGLENRMPSEVSGGQQQRTAIARALAPEPPILLMDEPFSSLDPQLRYEMGELIRNLQKEMGVTIAFVTHDRLEGMGLSHEIALMIDGQIVQADPPQRLFHHPASMEAALYMGPCNFIPGDVTSEVFSCAFGRFPAPGQMDGMGHWLVRPHHVRISVAEDKGRTSVDAPDLFEVVDCQLFGKEANCRLLRERITLNAEMLSEFAEQPGTHVRVTLPDVVECLIKPEGKGA